MLWVLFSLLAALTWAVTNIIDKFVLSKWVKNEYVVISILGLVGLVIGIFISIFKGLPMIPPLQLGLALFAGVLSVLFVVFYFKAVQIEEISRVVPLFYFSPVFTALLAALFLGEVFGPLIYLGVVLIVLGAILITSKDLHMIRLGKAFWLMILSSLCVSAFSIITKYLLRFGGYWQIFSYTRFGAMIAVLPILFLNYSDFRSALTRKKGKIVSLVSFNEFLNASAQLLILVALSTGFVTLVNAFSSVQPFFVLVLTVFLSLFRPGILREEIDKTTVLVKILAISLMFVGALIIL